MFEHSIRLMPTADLARATPDPDIERRFDAAAALFRDRDAAAAEQALQLILAERPDHTASLNLLALIAGRDGRDEECVALLERAIIHGAVEQAAPSALFLGATHERHGRIHAAENAYRHAVAAAPMMAQPRLKLGLLLLRQGEYASAADALREAAALDPGVACAVEWSLLPCVLQFGFLTFNEALVEKMRRATSGNGGSPHEHCYPYRRSSHHTGSGSSVVIDEVSG